MEGRIKKRRKGELKQLGKENGRKNKVEKERRIEEEGKGAWKEA